MTNPYSEADMFRPADEGRSLHDDLNRFFSQALYMQTPVKEGFDAKRLADRIYMLPIHHKTAF